MQKRRTEDAVHVVMTDHRIHRLPIAGGLAPLSERHDRFAGRVRLLYPPELPDTPMERIYLTLANKDVSGLQNALWATPVSFAEPHFRLGELLRQAGQFEDALTALRRAIQLSPQDARPYVLAAELMMNRRETKAAIDLLEPALAKVSDRIPLLNALSILYVAENRVDDALRLLNEAIQARPDDAVSWLNLGVCLETKRDTRGAAAAYTQSLSIDPASTRAMQYLRRVSVGQR
jgi:Flp pilus assembly protein TadD